MEQTLVLLKPDAVVRRLCGEILSRFERKGLKIVEMRMLDITPELSRVHYADHVGKSFYPDLEKYITSERVIAIVLEGEEAVAVVRKIIGTTNGIEAEAGTIRGDFSMSKRQNLVHASDSIESAQREIKIFFTNDKE
jgi:nucleoside-diphosphate kinase